MYRLCSVIVHVGTPSMGHFYTYRRVGGGRWVQASDADVSWVTLHTVLHTPAYMLFYESWDPCASIAWMDIMYYVWGQCPCGLLTLLFVCFLVAELHWHSSIFKLDKDLVGLFIYKWKRRPTRVANKDWWDWIALENLSTEIITMLGNVFSWYPIG